jgi:hypothetical protein
LIEFADTETIVEISGRGASTTPPPIKTPSVVLFAKTSTARLFVISTAIT